ncbi:echinoderm microtubule-associated protein-like 2 [Panonychus citri]|uniref:echinoderm microtubule-associated protein-like 2 n=1 Tax=Panonychus citri TaxID=50023 RepID=UPI002307DBEB|nr:echinoderm microtubule-associated protein-like 2 [Panonychus citri]
MVDLKAGPHPILSLQWSTDNCFLLTSVNDNNYQELIIWDLPNFRYLTGISSSSENLKWHEATCSGGEDVRGIWDNHNINEVINVCCHCSPNGKYLVTGDEDGHIRLFSYPCSDPMAAFYMRKQGSTGVVEARFLSDNSSLVTANFDGTLFLWNLYDVL